MPTSIHAVSHDSFYTHSTHVMTEVSSFWQMFLSDTQNWRHSWSTARIHYLVSLQISISDWHKGSMTSSALQISISVSVPSFYGCIELHGNWLPIYWRQSASPIQYIFANFYLPPTHVNVMKAWCVVVVEEYSSFGVVRCLRCSPSRRCCCLGHTPWWCRLDGIFTRVCHLCASDFYMYWTHAAIAWDGTWKLLGSRQSSVRDLR